VPSRERPIAVFDSGVGGLTVFRALRHRLPSEHLVYFGDTAHVPYGTKSPDTVRRLTLAHLGFLAARRVKCAVIACNTASAVALESFQGRMRFPLIGVIDPGVQQALERTRNGRIGVLGTSTTIRSGAYQRRLLHQDRRAKVTAVACPLFVPLAEEGWAHHPVARLMAREYLAPLRRAGVDTVILGCTHYPLLAPTLKRVLGPRVRLVDSADAVARETERRLAGLGLLRHRGARGKETFYLTDTGGQFPAVARRFLGRPISQLVGVTVRVKATQDVAVRARA
jgi:glutamate racemase